MDIKKVTLSFIAITLSLALVQFSLAPLAVAGPPHEQKTIPFGIIGTVIPSQSNENSNEPNYNGYFGIFIAEVAPGQLAGEIKYFFMTEDGQLVTNSGFIQGTYKSAKHGLMIQFSGDGFSGQLKEDPRYNYPGVLIGFIHTPSHGYLSQVFVAGMSCESLETCSALIPSP